MNPCHRLRLLAAALLCAVPPSASAQTIPLPAGPRVSHVPIQGGVSPEFADQYLDGRMRQAQTAAQMERVLNDLARNPENLGIKDKDREVLKEAFEKADRQPEKMLQDPNVQRIIREAAAKQEKSRDLKPEEREALREFAERMLPPSGPIPPEPGKPPPPASRTDVQPPPPPGGGPTKPLGTPSDTIPLPPPAPPAPPNSPVKDRLRDIAESLADKGLSDSPAFRRMLTNLDHVKAPEVSGYGRWEKRLQGLEGRFAEAGTRLPSFSWPKGNLIPRGARLPRAADAAQEAGGDGFGSALLLVAAAGAALLAWGLIRRRGLIELRRADGGWRLGPWPVRPEQVRTREELVRAFEYLALLLLGRSARNCNHREIAAWLGEGGAERHGAAERLAALYEQARYAPPDEALPEAEVAAARADLTLLAGVAAA